MPVTIYLPACDKKGDRFKLLPYMRGFGGKLTGEDCLPLVAELDDFKPDVNCSSSL